MLQQGKDTSVLRKAALCKFDKFYINKTIKSRLPIKISEKNSFQIFYYYISNCYFYPGAPFRHFPLTPHVAGAKAISAAHAGQQPQAKE